MAELKQPYWAMRGPWEWRSLMVDRRKMEDFMGRTTMPIQSYLPPEV